jgi:hypothetical protein
LPVRPAETLADVGGWTGLCQALATLRRCCSTTCAPYSILLRSFFLQTQNHPAATDGTLDDEVRHQVSPLPA